MKFMKIPNMAVLALMVVFVVIGLIALPFPEYLWRLLSFVVILAIGFALNMIRAIGAGDAKFAAAMAPFVALGDLPDFLYMFAAIVLAAFITHRLARRSDTIKKLTPDWESWTRRDFPMGLALGSTLAIYLITGALWGA